MSRRLQSAGTKGPKIPAQALHDWRHAWQFEMQRIHTLGVMPPDPSVQVHVLTHYVANLCESDREFEYRLNAYKMARNLNGAVTQDLVN